MKLEVGKLYQCKDYFLMLYPDPDTATTAATVSGRWVVAAAAILAAAYWSKWFGKPVSYADKNIPLLVINSKDKCIEVLAGNRKGWIICEDWLNIKEIAWC